MSFSYVVVIVTYNRLDLLKECIQHVVNQTVRPTSIVVVDNCCTDGSKEYLDEIGKTIKGVIIEHETENLGGAGGFNRGLHLAIEKSTAEWIMIIDDDAILDFSCMEKMNPFQSGISSNAYACTVMCKGEIDVTHRRNVNDIPDKGNYKKSFFECELATFCGLMINRQLVEKIGYPQADYFIWFDDTEYSMRICQYSDIVVLPSAFLNHKVQVEPNIGQSIAYNWKSYYGRRNIIDAYKRHRRWRLFMVQIIHAVKDIIIFWRKDRIAAQLVFDALKDGVLGKLGKNAQYLPKGK